MEEPIAPAMRSRRLIRTTADPGPRTASSAAFRRPTQPQHIIETGVWSLPFGAQGLGGGNRVVRALASNFKFSEIVQIYSGSPLAITGSACQVNPAELTCNPTVAPGFNGPGRIIGKRGQGATATSSPSYLNAAAFVPIATLTEANSPYAYTFGDAVRTAPFNMFGPGNYDIDISLRRTFGLFSEHSHLKASRRISITSPITPSSSSGAPFLAAPASAPSAARRIARAMRSCQCASEF